MIVVHTADGSVYEAEGDAWAEPEADSLFLTVTSGGVKAVQFAALAVLAIGRKDSLSRE